MKRIKGIFLYRDYDKPEEVEPEPVSRSHHSISWMECVVCKGSYRGVFSSKYCQHCHPKNKPTVDPLTIKRKQPWKKMIEHRSPFSFGLAPAHPMSKSMTYRKWYEMLVSTRTKNIALERRWFKFDTFLEDMGEAPDDSRLCRKDPLKGFTKLNTIYKLNKT